MAGGIIVWEFENAIGRYEAHEPHVSDYIEQKYVVFKSGSGGSSATQINLGTIDYNMSNYVVDFSNNTQISHSGARVKTIRRSVYPSTHPVANGIKWQWSGDYHGRWHDYDFEVAAHLEEELKKGTSVVDLNAKFPNMQYRIDLKTNEQLKVTTGFVRHVRRQSNNPFKYMSSAGAPARASTFTFGSSAFSAPSAHLSTTTTTTTTSSNVGGAFSMALVGNPFAFGSSSGLGASLFGAGAGPHAFSLPNGTHGLPGMPSLPSTGSVTSIVGVRRSHTYHGHHGSGHHHKRSRASGTSISNTSNSADHSDNAEDVIKNYVQVVTKPPNDEDCAICCDSLKHGSGYDNGDTQKKDSALKLKCAHMFHKSCLCAMYDNGQKDGSLQCPTCKKIFGIKHGNCPPGKMICHVMDESLPGHEGLKTHRIEYHISPGIQGAEHPSPGDRYSTRGFPRVGYLPSGDKGDKVLALLKKAWQRRLTFTVGTSVTTGEPNVVVWNEIHHKTEFGSNQSGHGFPDPNYLDNVLAEMAVHGVTEDT